MAEYSEFQYINTIDCSEIGEERYHIINISKDRIMLTGQLACLHEGYKLTVYDAQLVTIDDIIYYLSSWQYADIDNRDEQLKSAVWVKSRPYVYQTSVNESYIMAKTILEVRISENSGTELRVHDANEIKGITNDNPDVYGIIKNNKDHECEIAIVILNKLVSKYGEEIHVEH